MITQAATLPNRVDTIRARLAVLVDAANEEHDPASRIVLKHQMDCLRSALRLAERADGMARDIAATANKLVRTAQSQREREEALKRLDATIARELRGAGIDAQQHAER
ncbi:MAG: hypothetical protein JF599_13945 [Verrucomicrobia bacterium]|nr:hypothetical protein [Verrucomicrobiota bacterium]